MRESNIRHYRPKFISPFYPWIHIIGIIGLVSLIIGMGLIPILFAGGFVCFGFAWYRFYAYDRIWREYSLLHVIERITGMKKTGYLVDEELREILIDRDEIEEDRFERLLHQCEILDLKKLLAPDHFARMLSERLAERTNVDEKKLYKLITCKKNDSNMVLHPGVGIFTHIIESKDQFELVFVRSRKGIFVSEDVDPIHAFIVVIASSDQMNFYWHSLMWLAQLAEQCDFTVDWLSAVDEPELRSVIIDAWKKKSC
jgi:mannitol/fructose-specific phosphotransferase system IIA component (Ntr-type)